MTETGKEKGAEKGKLILLRREGKIVSLFLQDNRLLRASASTQQQFQVGDIVIGKVKNIVQNIQAAFVDLGQGTLCFLPLADISCSILVNRAYDGRILAGDEIVVQLCREAVKTKDPVADTRLSFPGKYAVVSTGGSGIRYSARLNTALKKRFKQLLEEHGVQDRLDHMGIIIRTNAAGLPEDKLLLQEIDDLLKQAGELVQRACSRTCFSVLKKAPEPFLAGIRNLDQDSCDKILTDDTGIYEAVREFLREYQPEDLGKLALYEDTGLSMNSLYGLETKLNQALARQVWLPSGGYLVIEPTEALTVIDVNSGKYSGRKKLEDTFYMINREACEEIAVQIPLRNLSGIILVDFINMREEERRRELLRYLTRLLQKDRIGTTVVDMTPLGLVEITRKKIEKTLAEQMR